MIYNDDAFQLTYADEDTRTFAKSRDELAQILGCATITVARMLHEPGNPGRRANGSYSVAEWKDYFREREDFRLEENFSSSQKSDLAAARLRRELARAAREELLLEKTRGTLVPADEVRAKWADLLTVIKDAFYTYFVLNAPQENLQRAKICFSRALAAIHRDARLCSGDFSGASSGGEAESEAAPTASSAS